MLSEDKIRTLLQDLKVTKEFYHHKDYIQFLELQSKIEVLEWILKKD